MSPHPAAGGEPSEAFDDLRASRRDRIAHSNKLVATSVEIAATEPGSGDISFMHSILCQLGLPRKKVTGDTFMRRQGAAWLSVQAGYLDLGNGPVQMQLPYGAMPRLALAWVTTYAVVNRTREIPIGDSAAEFLRMMGMSSDGHRFTTLRTQMHALAACRLQLGYRGRTFNGQPVEQFDAWVRADGSGRQRALWPGVMVLSDSYSKSLFESAVPLDRRALLSLKGSALALDVYTWLAHRLHRIEGQPQTLGWGPLKQQFAQEYLGKRADKDFKVEFLAALHKVLAVYPKAKVKRVLGKGLELSSSPPPIAPRAGGARAGSWSRP